MTTRHAVQTISRATLTQNAGADDLPWENVPGHGDYTNPGEAWAAAEEFDEIFDSRYAHRVVEVEIEPEPEEPAPLLPVKAPTPRRQLAEHRAQEGFMRTILLLEEGLRLDYARIHLDPLVVLCDLYLAQSGSSVLTARWRVRLDALRTRAQAVGNLRLVK
jgi:hypothetical protein